MTIYAGPVVQMHSRSRTATPYEIKAAAGKSDEADIYLYDVIGDSWEGTTGKQFATDLKAFSAAKTLNVYINSPGGSVFDGVAIHNVLKRHKARKIVHIDGLAASIASVIAMAGDEIQIASNGMMMIHDPWAIAMGNSRDFRKMADSLDKVRDAILASYVDRSTSSEEDLTQWMADETWFTAAEAVEVGLADSISDEVAMAALSKHDLSMFRHTPESLAAAVAAMSEEQAEQTPHDAKPHSAITLMEARLMKRGMNRQGQPA